MEKHLIIIWENARVYETQLMEMLLNSSLVIEAKKEVKWPKDNFTNNLKVLYGLKLPKNKTKEKYCGYGPFLAFKIIDNHPKYELRKTSSGTSNVNVNIYDLKTKMRNLTGGGHLVHATDNTTESNEQINLFFPKKSNQSLFSINNSFESINDFFYWVKALRLNYVVLRNFEDLEKVSKTEHPDVDLLVLNKEKFIRLTGLKTTTSKKYRAQYYLFIAETKIFFDIRTIGDNYYDYKWAQNILDTRIKQGNTFIPNPENHFYSLLYHALIHKRFISGDYYRQLDSLYNELEIREVKYLFQESNHIEILQKFLIRNKYEITSPKDLSVYFNINYPNLYKVRLTPSRKLKILYLVIRSNAANYYRKIKKIISFCYILQ